MDHKGPWLSALALLAFLPAFGLARLFTFILPTGSRGPIWDSLSPLLVRNSPARRFRLVGNRRRRSLEQTSGDHVWSRRRAPYRRSRSPTHSRRLSDGDNLHHSRRGGRDPGHGVDFSKIWKRDSGRAEKDHIVRESWVLCSLHPCSSTADREPCTNPS